jgi:hypothetical protein
LRINLKNWLLKGPVSLANRPFPGIKPGVPILIICDESQYQNQAPWQNLVEFLQEEKATLHFLVVSSKKELPQSTDQIVWVNQKMLNWRKLPTAAISQHFSQNAFPLVVNITLELQPMATAFALSLPNAFHVQLNHSNPYAHLAVSDSKKPLNEKIEVLFGIIDKLVIK